MTTMNLMLPKEIKKFKHVLKQKGIEFNAYKDQVIFEKSEIVKDDGNPYKVYTPYSRKWLSYFDTQYLEGIHLNLY